MNISDMKELDHLTVDMLADAFGGINCKCSDFSGKIECAYSPMEDNYLDFGGEIEYTYSPMEDKWRVRKEVHGEEEMAKKENEVMKMPSTVGVVQRKNTTVVNWDDGVKTVVTLKEDDYIDQMFVGFCIAYTKRMLGSTTKLLETIERCDTDERVRILKETAKNFRKNRDLAQKKEDRIRREKKFNEMVDEEFMRMRAAKEAKARYNNYIHEHKTNKKEK